MSKSQVIWYRTVSRRRTGPWKLFFVTEQETDVEKLILKNFEHLILPYGEYPDESSRRHDLQGFGEINQS